MAKQIFRIPGLGVGEVVISDDLFDTWYVDSNNGASGASGKTPKAAITTVDAANNLAAAGDTVHVLEGHAEDIDNATDWVPDTAGIKYVGHGRGARRPTFTFTAAGSNVPISGASVEVHNMLFVCDDSVTIDVAAGITVSAADVLLQDIELREGDSLAQFVDAIIMTTGGDRSKVDGYVFAGIVAGDATQTALLYSAALDSCVITNARITGEFATGAIECSAATTRMFMKDLYLHQEGAVDAVLTVHANTTGLGINIYLANVTADDAGFLAALTAANEMMWYNLQISNTKGMHAASETVPAAKGWASGPAQIT